MSAKRKLAWGLGLLVLGALVQCGTRSTVTINGALESCSALDLAKLVIGVVVAAIGVSAWAESRVICVGLVVAGAAMVAAGLNTGGVLCR